MTAVERSLPERVSKLEAGMDAVVKGIEDIKQEMRETRQEIRDTRQEVRDVRQEVRDLGARMDSRFDSMQAQMNARFERADFRLDSWLKWVLGFIFSSWLTIMATLLVKH